jgi:DNA/RNA-binding domain of Phe-tRNA-synthetase-like protein
LIKQPVQFTISDDVFSLFPGYVRGVVVARGLTNDPSSDQLVTLLRTAETEVRGKLNSENIAENPRISAWRDAYRALGAKPTKYRPSIEAMVRRVLKNDPLPSINALVDIGNVVSLRHLVPAGAHAIDVLTGDIELRLAKGNEEFTPLDSEEIEHPVPGEIIFAEGQTILTRRWTWRQGKHTLVLPETTAVEFNVDGLSLVPVQEIEGACLEIMSLIERFCGGETRYEILSRERPQMNLF